MIEIEKADRYKTLVGGVVLMSPQTHPDPEIDFKLGELVLKYPCSVNLLHLQDPHQQSREMIVMEKYINVS